ncbi:hypothetical protein [Erythrobacter mangrovi]|uniref:MarR family transcriptional regulator n=1 Tax=Erythrobacter mangrovi TaxID=2739433 RepID=A0A7D4ATZ6_9SPHN|nr:hypothetical protein [Erythrobacter mangrovi]QKG71517.1 hypothetical protein HQR01_09170 [Erythrobacter mangrovi]
MSGSKAAPGQDFNHFTEIDCENLTDKLDADALDTVLLALCQAGKRERSTTIWDLPTLTGLSLQDVFSAVRALEFNRFVRIYDNPADPFASVVSIELPGVHRLSAMRSTPAK